MTLHQSSRQIRARRAGRLSLGLGLALSSVVLASALVVALVLLGRANQPAAGRSLTIYCAAGLRPVMDRIVEQYQRECGASIHVQYGGSNTLLSQVEVGRVGDLFFPGDEEYARLARARGLAREIFPVAAQRPVIAVPKGNPRGIRGVADLARDDVRVALGNPDQTAIGKLVRQLLQKSRQWDALDECVRRRGVYKPTVNDLANDLAIGGVDAAIVWNTTLHEYPALEAISAPELSEGKATIALCVLTSAHDPAAALHFARYVSAKDRGLPVFADYGYEPVDGDQWEEVPQLTFYIGSVNRRALETTLAEFQRREGVEINTVYNGCGILTAQMAAIRDKQGRDFPDVYMACDVYYLENVKDWFQEVVHVSETDITMVVRKGNPKNIRTLQDLVLPGTRVIIGQPNQCTIGALTTRLLEKEGLFEPIIANVVAQTATSAMLVPAITTGSADVALAFATDAKAESDRVDALPIDSPYSKAIQPFAIARTSQHKHVARRLFQAISESGEVFTQAGFCFKCSNPTASAEGQPVPLLQPRRAAEQSTGNP